MTPVIDSDRADEWGEPVRRHAMVFHARTVSCLCGRMLAVTADDTASANAKWQAHVRDRADRLGARP